MCVCGRRATAASREDDVVIACCCCVCWCLWDIFELEAGVGRDEAVSAFSGVRSDCADADVTIVVLFFSSRDCTDVM